MAPTRPRRQPRTPRGDGGGRPWQSNRDQIHAWLVTTDKVRSPWDGRYHRIYKVLTCTTPNLIYILSYLFRLPREAWCYPPLHRYNDSVKCFGSGKRSHTFAANISAWRRDRGILKAWPTVRQITMAMPNQNDTCRTSVISIIDKTPQKPPMRQWHCWKRARGERYVCWQFRVVINERYKVWLHFILSPEDFLRLLGAHQVWSIW